MEVKIYREPENESLILNEEDLVSYNQLALELGFKASDDTSETKVPNVYMCLNSAMQIQIRAICPQKVEASKYTRSTIPLEVLTVYKFAKDHEMFEGFYILFDDVKPDPILVGWKYEDPEDRKNGYSWLRSMYLIARWGDCAMELPELLEMGYQRIKQSLEDRARELSMTINNILGNIDLYTRKVIQGTIPQISFDYEFGKKIE